MTLASPQLRRFSKREYLRLAEEGMFEGQHVQLIDGEIIEMAPQGHDHVFVLHRVAALLREMFEPQHWVRIQSQLDLGDSQPEPDIAVAEHEAEYYPDHPRTALLAIEISHSTYRIDRRKANLYASAGIPEYWIVNVAKRQVEVFRSPVEDSRSEFGHRYSERKVLAEKDTISPLARVKVRLTAKSFFA